MPAHEATPDAPAHIARHYKAAQEAGTLSVARWVGHPSVREQVAARCRDALEAVGEPGTRWMTKQSEIARYCWWACEIAAMKPDLQRAGGRLWLIPNEDMPRFERGRAEFRRLVAFTARQLTCEAVPIEPSWPGDLAVLGELLLMSAFGTYRIEWGADPHELAASLNAAGDGLIEGDGLATRFRAGTAVRGKTRLLTIQHDYEQRTLGARSRAPYADGGERQTGRSESGAAAHTEAIARWRREYPRLNVRALTKVKTGKARRRYEQIWQEITGRPLEHFPSQSSLYRYAQQADTHPASTEP